MSARRHPALVVAHYGTLILLAVVCVAPIILMFATSLKLQTQIFNTGINFIFAPTLENYRDVLGEDSFKRYLGNSLMVGVVSTVITLVLGCMAAYGLARFRFPGRSRRGAVARAPVPFSPRCHRCAARCLPATVWRQGRVRV